MPKRNDGEDDNGSGLLKIDHRLVALLGEEIPAEELRIWAVMPEKQRAKALQRMKALTRYCASGADLPARTAARDAGVELGRFYQMAREWRNRRSLESVGTSASVTRSRNGLKPEVANALQAVVNRVVTDNKDASLTHLARMLGIESKLAKPPALNTLRLFIEREQRRLRASTLAGDELLFDLAATSLVRADGRPYVLFLVIDQGTGMIFGHAEGNVDDSLIGYRAAARDALLRIPTFMPPSEIWAEKMARAQIVPGGDASAISEAMSNLKIEVGGASPQLTGPDRGGSYIRRSIGLNLGSVRLIPTRTYASPEPQPGSLGLTFAEAHSRIEIAVVDHNARLLAGLELLGSRLPPATLTGMLETMAGI